MSLNYKVLTCSQDSRYPQDLVLTLRFDGEAPDANEVICLVQDAPDLLGALEDLKREIILSDVDMSYIESHFMPWINKARAVIAKARGES